MRIVSKVSGRSFVHDVNVRRNHKLEDGNDHPRIKETCFHVVARELVHVAAKL